MKIYVASSWRNQYQQEIVADLRNAGHEVYDFRNPPGRTGFSWREVDQNWSKWPTKEYRRALQSKEAQAGFKSDFDAMKAADLCVLALPCGRSAHLEAGWFAGAGKPVHVLVGPELGEAELMYLLAGDPMTQIHEWMKDLLEALGTPFQSRASRIAEAN